MDVPPISPLPLKPGASVVELVDSLHPHWPIYIGNPSIVRFQFFLDGYILAASPPDGLVMRDFGTWVAKNYNVSSWAAWSSTMLLKVSRNDLDSSGAEMRQLIRSLERSDWDAEAFYDFWCLWPKFLEQPTSETSA